MIRSFNEISKRRYLKISADKSKRMMLKGKEGLVCEISVNGANTDYKYFGINVNESDIG